MLEQCFPMSKKKTLVFAKVTFFLGEKSVSRMTEEEEKRRRKRKNTTRPRQQQPTLCRVSIISWRSKMFIIFHRRLSRFVDNRLAFRTFIIIIFVFFCVQFHVYICFRFFLIHFDSFGTGALSCQCADGDGPSAASTVAAPPAMMLWRPLPSPRASAWPWTS